MVTKGDTEVKRVLERRKSGQANAERRQLCAEVHRVGAKHTFDMLAVTKLCKVRLPGLSVRRRLNRHQDSLADLAIFWHRESIRVPSVRLCRSTVAELIPRSLLSTRTSAGIYIEAISLPSFTALMHNNDILSSIQTPYFPTAEADRFPEIAWQCPHAKLQIPQVRSQRRRTQPWRHR